MASQAIKNKFLINAPAGSGKTTSIRNHLKSIYMDHPESKVLCITYTNRAADELKKDLESPNITVSTIHSYINELIKPFFGQTEAINLYWELYGRKISERIENSNGDERIAESNQHYIEKFGSLSLDIVKSNIDELSYGETPFTSLYTGKLSHDDLLMFAYYLIKKYPVILRKISDKYNYIFIDEYQDTSAFILKIFYEAVKDRPNVMLYLLGDRMQQIYHNYDGSFEEQFKEFDTSKKLDTNHRSIGEIISILNRIYNDNRFDQNPSDKNRDLKPDIPPKILVSSDIKEKLCTIDFQCGKCIDAELAGVFRTRIVLFVLLLSGNTVITSFPSNSTNASLSTRCASLLIKTKALFAAIASSEISIQSHVSPKSSPKRREHENARLIASFNLSSSHISNAYITVSAVQISRSFLLHLGVVAKAAGFLSISSHFTAC